MAKKRRFETRKAWEIINKNQANMTKKKTSKTTISLEVKEKLCQIFGCLFLCCFIVSLACLRAFTQDIPPDKSQLLEVNGVIERDRHGKYDGIKVKDFESGKTYGCSLTCNYIDREKDIGKTGKFLIYKSTVCQVEVDGQMKTSYEGTVEANKFNKTVFVYFFVTGVVSLLIYWRAA